jgi:hypothetical protein
MLHPGDVQRAGNALRDWRSSCRPFGPPLVVATSTAMVSASLFFPFAILLGARDSRPRTCQNKRHIAKQRKRGQRAQPCGAARMHIWLVRMLQELWNIIFDETHWHVGLELGP